MVNHAALRTLFKESRRFNTFLIKGKQNCEVVYHDGKHIKFFEATGFCEDTQKLQRMLEEGKIIENPVANSDLNLVPHCPKIWQSGRAISIESK